MRRTLIAVAAALVLLGAAPARADYMVQAGLGQRVGPTWFTVKACHKSDALTLVMNEDGNNAYPLRVREGDLFWDEVARQNWMPVMGAISVQKIENCIGTFVIHYQKKK